MLHDSPARDAIMTGAVQLECDALTERSRLQSPPGKEKEIKDHAISQDGPRRPALLVFDVHETPRTCLPTRGVRS